MSVGNLFANMPGWEFLADPPRPAERLPYVAGSDTSEAAAESMKPNAATLRARVLALLKARGPLTDEEMQSALGMNANTQRPRRCELVAAGLVRDSGKTRKTRSNRSAVVWEATP